ncbi:hypothetical protein H0H81_005850 [Sphagnurus paluster]|uniref:Eukaryotic translation initiation factor 3 subunit M n=1 Tax=Sphagnurus paluster TaxID=117069 RepID=A0A9P7G2K6_9AGAR|nr:hypothetical protein H0H81_005850 [Sphagnurus paluster]
MAITDSISVFAEGTFEEQIQELVNYIVRNRSEEERAAFIRPFQDALKTPEGKTPLEEDAERKRKIFQMVAIEVKGLGDGTDKGMPKSLSNLFNAINRPSPLRLLVYTALIQTTSANGDLDTLQITRTQIERWLSEWDISQSEKADFLKIVSAAYETVSQPENAYEYEQLYIRELPSDSPTIQDGAVNLIATALRLPTVFDFDPLFKLDAVLTEKGHDLYSLLQIFLNSGLPEFQAWEASHADLLEKHRLDRTQLQRKIRLLTLASLAFHYVGRDLPYSKVAEALQVDVAEVEKWAIDVIRAGLVWGKLSQTTQSLHITRATARTFEKEQWEALEKRLLAWKTGLSSVLDVVVNAKRQAGFGQPQNAI